MTVEISTARMTLRPLTLDDLDRLVELDADPAVMTYLTGGPPTTREQWRAHLESRVDDDGPRPEHGEVEYELRRSEWVRLPAWPHPS